MGVGSWFTLSPFELIFPKLLRQVDLGKNRGSLGSSSSADGEPVVSHFGIGGAGMTGCFGTF